MENSFLNREVGLFSSVPSGDVRDVITPEVNKGVGVAMRNMYGMVNAMAELDDFTREMEQERLLRTTVDEAEREAERRLSLPDGDKESFFDASGKLSMTALKNFLNPYGKIMGGIGVGFHNTELGLKMQAKAQFAGDGLFGNLLKQGEKAGRQKAEDAWRDCYELAIEKGDYGSAKGLIDRGVGQGLFSKERGELMKLKLGKRSAQTRKKSEKLGVEFLESLKEEQGGEGLDVAKQIASVAGDDLSGMSDEEKADAEYICVWGSLGMEEQAKELVSLKNAVLTPVFKQSNEEVGREWHLFSADGVSGKQGEILHGARYQISEEQLDDHIWSLSAYVHTAEEYEHLSQADKEKMVVDSVCELDGLAEQLQPENRYAKEALKNRVLGIVEKTRGVEMGKVKRLVSDRIDKQLATSFGRGRLLGALRERRFVDDFGGETTLSKIRGADIDEGWFSDSVEKKVFLNQIMPAYKEEYMRDSVFHEGELPEEGADIDVEKAHEWYFMKGGVYEQEEKEFIEFLKEFYTEKVAQVQAVSMRNGDSWAETQRKINEVFDKISPTSAWDNKKSFKENMNETQKKRAGLYRAEYEKTKTTQTELERVSAEKKNQRELAEQEAKEEARKEAKLARDFAKEVENRKEREKYPYRFIVKQKVGYKAGAVKDGKSVEEYGEVVVPVREYERMLLELGANENMGIYCQVKGKNTRYLVRPGKVDKPMMNAKMLYSVMPANNPEGLKRAVNGGIELDLRYKAY